MCIALNAVFLCYLAPVDAQEKGEDVDDVCWIYQVQNASRYLCSSQPSRRVDFSVNKTSRENRHLPTIHENNENKINIKKWHLDFHLTHNERHVLCVCCDRRISLCFLKHSIALSLFCGLLTLNKVGLDTKSSRVTEAKRPTRKVPCSPPFSTNATHFCSQKTLPALDPRKKKVTSKQYHDALTPKTNRLEPLLSIEFALSGPRSSPILSSSPQNQKAWSRVRSRTYISYISMLMVC